jgi:hypothetical protein
MANNNRYHPHKGHMTVVEHISNQVFYAYVIYQWIVLGIALATRWDKDQPLLASFESFDYRLHIPSRPSQANDRAQVSSRRTCLNNYIYG